MRFSQTADAEQTASRVAGTLYRWKYCAEKRWGGARLLFVVLRGGVHKGVCISASLLLRGRDGKTAAGIAPEALAIVSALSKSALRLAAWRRPHRRR